MDYYWPGVYTGSPYTSSLPNVSLSACQWATLYCERANRFGTICEKQDGVTQISGAENIGVFGSQILTTINKNIELLSGADVVITGKIKLAPDVAIVVRRGARLTIDNAVLSSCDPSEEGRWEGIFIEGNYDLEQPSERSFPLPTEAGVVRVYNGNISDCSSVLRTYRFEPASDYSAGWDRAYWGGVMYVRDSEFKNNKRVAEFMKYEKENKSLFHGTQFYGKQDATRSDRAITAWAVNGISVDQGCNFYDFSNQAIYSINAFFKINNSNFRFNTEAVVLEYTRSHTSVMNEIGIEGGNEFSANIGAVCIVTSDFQFRNNSSFQNNFVSNAEDYYVETYGTGQINIDNNSFTGAEGGAYIWSTQPRFFSSINCNVFNGAGVKNRGLSISGDQFNTVIEGNVFSGLESALVFQQASGTTFIPKESQGNPSISHGNFWIGNEDDIVRSTANSVRNHAEVTYYSHTFDQGQVSEFNPDESSTYGGGVNVVMAQAFFENDCTAGFEVEDPIVPTGFPCEDFAGGGLSPDHPDQRQNLAALSEMMDDAYASQPTDASSIVDLVDCLSQEDQLRLYYLSLNFTHDETLYQAVRNSESLSLSDIAGLERARQVWLFENSLLGEDVLLDYYEMTCADSKLAKPYIREHNFVIHRKVSDADYLSCEEEADEPATEFFAEQPVGRSVNELESCTQRCAGVTYSVIDLISGVEMKVDAPTQVVDFEVNIPYRYVKTACPTHGTHLSKTFE
ncbi:MAG: hypothetical protein AB8F78_06425 [Saprospiraceae bacterium]